jgi:purine-binding chemotaxis protein CheW
MATIQIAAGQQRTGVARAGAGQYLSFTLGEEEYGVEILRVQEIRGYSTVTRIPHTPEHIEGVISLRGAVVPVVDLRAKFRLPQIERTRFTVIVLVAAAGKTIGLIVDAVSDVLNLSPADIQPAPDLGASCDTSFLRGVGAIDGRLVALLDMDQLLGADVAEYESRMKAQPGDQS